MKKFLLPLLAATILSGCASITPEFTDEVTINSKPCGADVIFEGKVMGQTPMSVELPRGGNFEITLAKKGYKNEVIHLMSVRSTAFVKFGPLVDMGYYRELTPNPVDANMVSVIIPDSKGLNPFRDMAEKIRSLDEQRKAGQISPEEHSLQIKQILKFYGK